MGKLIRHSILRYPLFALVFASSLGLMGGRAIGQNGLKTKVIQRERLELEWDGVESGWMGLAYGRTPALEMGRVIGKSLDGLQAGTLYYVQPVFEDAAKVGQVQVFATESASSGDIKVYFNHPVDHSASTLTDANYILGMEDTLAAYIGRAQATLDICNYNTGSQMIVNAVNQAASNGVVVRYIAADNTGTNNSQLGNLSPTIPMIQRPNDGEVMHNKFMIVDADSPTLAKVVTGSVNHTPNSCTDDYNNLVIVEDQSLALAYRLEFEEMWGGTGNTPNPGNAKFGSAKTDNTPHQFVIGGRNVELYFSPSDATTAHIESAILSADNDLEFAMFTFIHNDLGDAVKTVFQTGAEVKGMMENIYYFGSEFNGLVGAGVNVQSHFNYPGWLHHKYGIVDAKLTSSDPLVITGSHNWTNSAEEDYDENTLIIHDAILANQYLEEFTLRFSELTGTGNAPLVELQGAKISPNPFRDGFLISAEEPIQSIESTDVMGQRIHLEFPKYIHWKVRTETWPSGIYFIRVNTRSGSRIFKQLKQD